MKNKIVIFAVAIVVLALLFWWSGHQDKTGNSTPSIANMSETTTPMEGGHSHGAATETPTVSSATIAVQGMKGEDLGEVKLVPGTATPLPNTPYELRMTEFYTYWNWDSGAINVSREERNPAAKIEVLQDGKVLYYGWAFQNMEFFRMQMHNNTDKEAKGGNSLAFTLRAYDGLKWSQGDADKGEKG